MKWEGGRLTGLSRVVRKHGYQQQTRSMAIVVVLGPFKTEFIDVPPHLYTRSLTPAPTPPSLPMQYVPRAP